MVDKNYCMSSFLAFRYIEDESKDFFPGMHHHIKELPLIEDRIPVFNEDDIDCQLSEIFATQKTNKLGILLSGGMDSAVLATYMPKGSRAYTFRFQEGKYEHEELLRAERFAKECELDLHYVDICWEDVEKSLSGLMWNKCAPVHSIEPQVYLAAVQAKRDGIEKMVIGDAADYVFYGMDGLLSRDWLFEDYIKRSVYIMPDDVLVNPADIRYLYERYREGEKIDYIGFYDKCITEESYDSYANAFKTADLPYIDPYENFILGEKLDLKKTRNGESKYFIRALFKKRYPGIDVPEKHPMPRPVDYYFNDWRGPVRPEFKKSFAIESFTGNQKWLLYCLERFLDEFER